MGSLGHKETVAVPVNVSVLKNGYVYYNSTTVWKDSSDKSHKYADHKKICIGKIKGDVEGWRTDRRMIPNSNYAKYFDIETLPEMPERSDNISVGLYAAVKSLIASSGLGGILSDVFGSEDSWLILDLSMYMLSHESAVFQHFPHWGKSHALFSKKIRSDSYISGFEKDRISLSKINLFKKKWAMHVISNGELYFCYDSTNVNSQAEGVFLVQKGHAKDDASLPQVNTDYVVRQKDGLPVTFTAFPGSIVDMAEASEMVSFFDSLFDGDDEIRKTLRITLICDRGYISEENVELLDNAGMDFLLMLRRNMGITERILENFSAKVKRNVCYVRERDQYVYTVAGGLFDGDAKTRYFHIVWDGLLEKKHRKNLYAEIDAAEERLKKIIARKTLVHEDEIKRYRRFFRLELEQAGRIRVKKKGRGTGEKETDGYIVRSATKDNASIDKEMAKCGYYVLVTSKAVSGTEAIEAYSKRDCVEKVFQALKSWLGMDKLGVHFDDSIHSKSLIWFVAAILHSLIFTATEKLRTEDRKSYTTPNVIDLLEEISADRNLSNKIYERRYRPTKKQNAILQSLGVKVDEIDKMIRDL